MESCGLEYCGNQWLCWRGGLVGRVNSDAIIIPVSINELLITAII